MNSADLIVIGAGPGGYEVAAERARAGENVVIIDFAFPGGTCLNRGCIPTKCLAAAADTLLCVNKAADFGIHVDNISVDYHAVTARMNQIVEGLRQDVQSVLTPCTFVHGEAKILPDGSVAVGDQVYNAPKVLIATGSAPASLNIPGAEKAINSDGLLQMESLPQSLAIIGAGVIGLEFASIMAAFGVQVTVIEYLKEVLPPFDKEVAKRLRTMLTRRGIKFVMGAAVKAIADNSNTKTVTYTGKKGDETIDVEQVAMAVGRRPVTPQGLSEAGIDVDRRGYIIVDSHMQTTRPGFYAVGDCNGILQLAHAATAQARVALGEDVDLNVIPAAVFTTPEAAMVGLTAEQAEANGIEYSTAKALFAANGKARAMGHADGMVKFVYATGTGRLLGCHIVGPHAADLIQEATTAIATNQTLADIKTRIVHGHPTLCEVLAAAR